jgi:hypothetical protein
MKQLVNNRRVSAWLALAAVPVLAAILMAQTQRSPRPITVAQLAGPWSASLIGNTGCGWTTLAVDFTLDSSGAAMATYRGHSSGCGDSTSTEPFSVQVVYPNGSGSANLSCGTACGWQLHIQVAPNREIFSLVDVDPANPGNFLSGVAIRQL